MCKLILASNFIPWLIYFEMTSSHMHHVLSTFISPTASTNTFLGCAAILAAAQPLNPVIVVFCCCSVVLLLLAFSCFTRGLLT